MIAAIVIGAYMLVGILTAILMEWAITSNAELLKYVSEVEGLRPITGKPGGVQKLCILFASIWPVTLFIMVYGALSDDQGET